MMCWAGQRPSLRQRVSRWPTACRWGATPRAKHSGRWASSLRARQSPESQQPQPSQTWAAQDALARSRATTEPYGGVTRECWPSRWRASRGWATAAQLRVAQAWGQTQAARRAAVGAWSWLPLALPESSSWVPSLRQPPAQGRRTAAERTAPREAAACSIAERSAAMVPKGWAACVRSTPRHPTSE